METTKKSNPGRRFDEEFKRGAARLAVQPGRSDEQVARDLGVSAWSISRWRKQFGLSKVSGGSAAPAAAPPHATLPASPSWSARSGRWNARTPTCASNARS